MRYRVGIETRARILDATRAQLAESGLEGVTIKGICQRAGILAGSFYNLFSSKEEAILVVIREAIQMVEPDPEETADVASLVGAYIRFFEEHEHLGRVYIRVAVGGGVRDESLRARLMRHHERRVERFTDALVATGVDDAAQMAELMVAALNGLALHRILDPKFDFRGQAERLLTLRPGS
ncbi:hypothetical protein BH23ACT5_BH23ACT5_14860 [soil metagenome]